MADINAYFGMRGSGDWSDDERPKNWRQKILELDPNGDTPLTGILSKTRSEDTDDPEFNWWEQSLASQAADLQGVGVAKDATGSTNYTSSDSVAVGGMLYAIVTEAALKEIREGHMVMLGYYSATTPDNDRRKRGIVVGRTANGNASIVAVKMLEADSASASNLSTANRIQVIGNVNAEGASMPDGIQYDPTKFNNYTQIFRTPLRFTGTALKVNLRDSNNYKRQKGQILKYHGLEMEKALMYNPAPSESIGSNGEKQRIAGGLIYWIKQYASDNVDNYYNSADVSASTTWVNGGQDWLDAQLEKIFKYGNNQKLALCGTGALLAIQTLAKQYGNIQLVPRDRAYGLNVREWITPFGSLDLMLHPLFSHEKTENRSMLIVEPEQIIMRPLQGRDTHYKEDDRLDKGGAGGVDGIEEEFLTEIGWEIHHPETMGYLTGLGVTHSA